MLIHLLLLCNGVEKGFLKILSVRETNVAPSTFLKTIITLLPKNDDGLAYFLNLYFQSVYGSRRFLFLVNCEVINVKIP